MSPAEKPSQYCDHCHIKFGTHEKRIERPQGTYHEWCDHRIRYEAYNRLKVFLRRRF